MLRSLRGVIPVFILLVGILFLLYYVQGSILGFFLAAGKLSVGIEVVGGNGYLATVSNIGETDIETLSIFVTLPENSNITNPVDGSVEGSKLYWGLERLGAGEKKVFNFTAEAVGKIRIEAEGVGLIEKTEQFPVGREVSADSYNVSLAGFEKPVSLSLKIKTVSIETTTSAGVETTTTEETTTTLQTTTSTAFPPTTVLLGTNATGNETADSTTLNTTNTTTTIANITTTLQTTTSILIAENENTSTTSAAPSTTITENEEKEKKEKKEKQGGTGNLLADSPGTVWIDLDWEENGNEVLVFDGIEGTAVYRLGENATELRVLFRPREGFKQVLEHYEVLHLIKGKMKAEAGIEIEKKERDRTKGRELEAEGWFAREISDLTEKSVDLNYSAITGGFVNSRGLLLRVDNPTTFYGKVYRGQEKPVRLDFYFKTNNPSDCQIADIGIEVLFENGEGDTTYILGINANKTLSIEPLLDPDFSGTIEDADFGWQHVSATTRKTVPAGRLYRPFARSGSIGCLSGFENAVVSGFTVK